jgi:predicted amidophosphoribosyltransferase
MTIHPIELQGAWTRGWALDVHTTSSQFLGYSEQGHAQFDTIRSPLGELVYQLKYGGQRKAGEVATVMAAFFDNKPMGLAKIDLIIPMPASTARTVQPVMEIAKALANKLGKSAEADAVRKVRETPGLKNVYDPEERRELLEGAFKVDRTKIGGKGVLLEPIRITPVDHE